MEITKKVFILGDSVLKGVFLPDCDGHRKIYEDRTRVFAEHGIELVNLSRLGATVRYGVDLIAKKLRFTENDVVLLEYGGNDCDFDWKSVSENPDEEHFCKTPPFEFLPLYEEAVKTVKSSGAKVYICNLVPIDAKKYVSQISKGLSKEKILCWLGDESMLYRYHEHYSRYVESIAKRTGCPLIDLRSPFLDARNYGDLMSPDGIHPSVLGHKLIDETIIGSLS